MAYARLAVRAALVVLGVVHGANAAPSVDHEASTPQADARVAPEPRVVDQPARAVKETAVRDRASGPQELPSSGQSLRPKAAPSALEEEPKADSTPRGGLGKGRNVSAASGKRPRAGSGRTPAPEPTPGTEEAARLAEQHFVQALDAYRNGDYRVALAHLHRAAALDPGSKDLEYNLALVHERAGQPYDSIVHWRVYRQLETDPGERRRAELAIQRLQGAHARLLHMLQPFPRRGRGWQGSRTDLQVERRTERRFQDWAIGLSIASAAFLCLGVALGVKALRTDPDRGSAVGDKTYADLETRADRAHAYAIGADLAFAVGLGTGVAAGSFWFAEGDEERGLAAKPGVDLAVRGPGLRFGGEF